MSTEPKNLIQEMIEILRSEEGLFQKDYFSNRKHSPGVPVGCAGDDRPGAVESLYQVENPEAFDNASKIRGFLLRSLASIANAFLP